jgi:esterase/lipase superfamily enzyme
MLEVKRYVWPSKANTSDYFYDEGSAELSVDSFIELLQMLQMQSGIKTVHIVAHSMGNRIVLNAMAATANKLKSQKLAEVVFAAPDVDRDVFVGVAKKLGAVTNGMTLYASAADRPLGLKGWLASMPRAGDVTENGPVVVKGVESINMTVMGNDLFALNHSTFAVSPVIEDIARLVLTEQHPPNRRTSRIRAVPERAATPRYWRYSN